MAHSKQYGGITREELARLREDLARENVVVPEGDDVTFDATHGVMLRAVYSESMETLMVTIAKKPFFVPESRVWEVLDTGIQPYVDIQKLFSAAPRVVEDAGTLVSNNPHETHRKHKLFRFAMRTHLRHHGYSSEQAARMVGQIGDGKILAWIQKWGPTILKILLMILPLFLAAEPPHGQPSNTANPIDEHELAD
jgi:hypothetical protein